MIVPVTFLTCFEGIMMGDLPVIYRVNIKGRRTTGSNNPGLTNLTHLWAVDKEARQNIKIRRRDLLALIFDFYLYKMRIKLNLNFKILRILRNLLTKKIIPPS